MRTGLQTVKTEYGGQIFRSRGAARWAAFFDNLGVSFIREPEEYEIPSGRFCPDFFLPNENCFVHVTSLYSGDIVNYCTELALGGCYPVLYIVGTPGEGSYRIIYCSNRTGGEEPLYDTKGYPVITRGVFGEDRKAANCLWLIDECGFCSSLTVSEDPKHGDNWPMTDTPWIEKAYGAAKKL